MGYQGNKHEQQLRVGVVQMNPILGDIQANKTAIETYAQALHAMSTTRTQVVLFPELCLTGYPPEDLLLRPDWLALAALALEQLQQASERWPNMLLVVGVPLKTTAGLVNAAVALHAGQQLAIHEKYELPNYDVFDEKRYFTSSVQSTGVLTWRGTVFALSICEDIWFPKVTASAIEQGAQIMLNLNASPFHCGKQELRQHVLLQRLAQADNNFVIVYANQVGGQDELVFDGGSMVVTKNQLLSLPRFQTGIGLVDIKTSEPYQLQPVQINTHQPPFLAFTPVSTTDNPHELTEIYQALVLGTRDYITKNGFSKVFLGLSGGIDSALTLAIAVAAIGADAVNAVMMPFEYTAPISIEDAKTQAQTLGVPFSVVPIAGIYASVCAALSPLVAGLPADTTEENIQARSRGILLMALANKYRGLVLTTGNKSELAVGYSTLYGDMAGGFNPIKDLPKTQVYALANYLNNHGFELGFNTNTVIPTRVMTRAPSAELRPNQTDQDSLPDYEVLDAILYRFIELDQSSADMIRDGFSAADVNDVVRKVKLNEHKRRQAPPGVRLSVKAFGRDRRYPITARW